MSQRNASCVRIEAKSHGAAMETRMIAA